MGDKEKVRNTISQYITAVKIMETIDQYLTAVKTRLKEDFDKAFHRDAVVINAGEADPEKASMPVSAFAEIVGSLVREGTYVEEKAQSINVDHEGRVANVRLDFELRIGDDLMYGTDFFNLVKRDNEWRISQKIYDVTRVSKLA